MRALLWMGVLLGCATPAWAGVIGTSVSGSLVSNNGNLTISQQFASPSIAGPGVEFTGAFDVPALCQTFVVSVDIQSASFIVSITGTKDGNISAGPGDAIASIRLQFQESLSNLALDRSACSGNATCGDDSIRPTAYSTGPGLVSVDLNNLVTGQTFYFGFQDTAMPSVPEPASLALLAAGLAGVGAMRRRRVR